MNHRKQTYEFHTDITILKNFDFRLSKQSLYPVVAVVGHFLKSYCLNVLSQGSFEV